MTRAAAMSTVIAGLADEWRRAADPAPLAPNWRTAFARRVDTGRIEDWSRRLAEP